MSSPSTPSPGGEKVTSFAQLAVRVPDDFAQEFTALAERNTGTLSAEIRLAMRTHMADMKERGRAA